MQSLHLLYHQLQSHPGIYPYALEIVHFERHINLCIQLRAGDSSGWWPEITFDDGHMSNYELALPILQHRGVKASFFITAGWTGRKLGYMGWAEVEALHQAGHTIGAHGWTHTLLTQCSGKDLHMEVEKSRQVLEDHLGIAITAMSLPGGRFNRRVLAACRQAGYAHVYTSVPQAEPAPLGFTVGRLNIRRGMTLDWMTDLFRPGNRRLTRMYRQYQRKQTAKLVMGDRLYEKLWARVNRHEPDTGGDEAGVNE